MKQFNSLRDSFKDLSADGVELLIAAATDITLVLDSDGIIRNLSVGDDEMPNDEYEGWMNRPWLETVTVESRPKVEELLKQAGSKAATKWRHINHLSSTGIDLPIVYSTVRVGNEGKILAIGRNATKIAKLQQRLFLAQQSMEKNYLQSRHLETRYRLLFQVSSEAMLIVDATNLKVLEANPAAERLLGQDKTEIPGQGFTSLFEESDENIVKNLLVEIRTTGHGTQINAKLAGPQVECFLSASLFSQTGGYLYLIRVSQLQGHTEQLEAIKKRAQLLMLMESSPDGFVVTGSDGRIVAVNQAFLELTQTASEDRVRGESLDRWFGRSSVDLNVLTANLREHGSVRLFATTLRGEYGSNVDVEISATKLVMKDDEPSFGFMIRDIGIRLVDDSAYTQIGRSRPVSQLTELVGRLPLKDLVQESTNMVERYCIEAALEITGENRTSAAEILGLSRQSLYTKLRRYGIGNPAPEPGE